MPTWIALLRGINVGKKNRIKMAPLRGALERAGCTDVLSYLQSGNLVFSHSTRSALKAKSLVTSILRSEFDIETPMIMLKYCDLQAAADGNPFPDAEESPKTLHLWFLSHAPKNMDLNVLDSVKKASEEYALKGAVFYLSAPEGIGRSKLAAKVERVVGEGTARGWRTVSALLDLVD